MRQDNRWEETDRWAGQCAQAAIDSNDNWTIEDVCRALKISMPVSEDDLGRFYRLCSRWGIKNNMMGETIRAKGIVK